MNKTTTQSLLLCIILCVGILSIFSPIPKVHAYDPCDNWTIRNFSYAARSQEFAHGGILSMDFDETQAGVYQDISPVVAVNDMTSFTIWIHAHTRLFNNYNIYAKIYYNDGTSDTVQFSGSSSTWVQGDILAGLTAGKSMNRTEIYGSSFVGCVDDVSCLVGAAEKITNGGFEDPTGTAGERIDNYGFEFGNSSGWLRYGFNVGSGTVRTGSYSANFAYGSYGYQTIAPQIDTDLITVFECYVYPESQRAADYMEIKITYDDFTTDSWTTGSYGSWIQADLAAICDADKYIHMVKFSNFDSSQFETTHIDDFSLQASAPPSSFECRVVSSPEITATWELDATPYVTPWTDDIVEGSRTLEATEITATRDSGLNIYGFSHWMATNSSGSFNFTTASITLDIQTEHNFTIFYEKSYTIIVTSTPYTTATFTATGYAYTAPKTLTRNNATHTFVCTLFQIDVNSSYRYTFDYWSINGSGSYYSLNIDVAIAGDTNLTMHYLGSHIETPYIPSFTATAVNGTWYVRSDTHTIHEQLGYKLDLVNTYTFTYDSRAVSGTYNISYGIRVWVIDIFGNLYELSGGTPEAIVTRTTDGEGYQSAYFDCPAYSGLIDAVQVNVYQRFGAGAWSLRRISITGEDLYIKLPASSWEIYYYTNRTVASTTAYFFHGSSSYSSRILFQYYRANPWEIAMARLQAQNYLAFLFTPWTYYLGDIFWSLLLLFGIVTAYNRYGSLKPILALLWLLGGVGSFLSAMIPAIALSIAWLMLAVAMGITLFKLIYR